MKIPFPETNFIVPGLRDIPLPKLGRLRQQFDPAAIDDLQAHMARELDALIPRIPSLAGKRICITAGSRGIPNLPLILRTLCEKLKEQGAAPFLIPAMGSHGGATAEGQTAYLADLGVTADSVGAPILSSMEVVQYGTLEDGTPLYIDKYAWESDGIVLLNKIKPHTDFRGTHESGLLKMIAIGISKHAGAVAFHAKGFHTFADRIPLAADQFLDKCPVVFGVGIVQNAYDRISNLEIIPPEKIVERDAALLQIAKEKMAAFRYPKIDVLIIEQIGKNISGHGFDPNIVGRNHSGLPGFDKLDLQKLVILGLSPESHGNASGIGAADVSTRQCLCGVDWDASWTNSASCTLLQSARIPVYMNSDADAVRLAIKTLNGVDPEKATVVRIKDTLHMEDIWVSETYWEQAKATPGLTLLSDFTIPVCDGENARRYHSQE